MRAVEDERRSFGYPYDLLRPCIFFGKGKLIGFRVVTDMDRECLGPMTDRGYEATRLFQALPERPTSDGRRSVSLPLLPLSVSSSDGTHTSIDIELLNDNRTNRFHFLLYARVDGSWGHYGTNTSFSLSTRLWTRRRRGVLSSWRSV